jgi:hypothetical protein
MVVTGLYRSAVSIAEDVSLRRSVRKSMEKLGLLDSMGQSQVTEQIEKVVILARETANEMEEETGVKPSISDEVKEYLVEVVNELNKRK